MYRPQNLVAALFSAALLCTTGIALADKGGNHDKHGGSAAHGGSVPGQSSTGDSQRAGTDRGPGGIGGPRSSPGSFEQRSFDKNNRTDNGMRGSQFEGSVDADASKRGMMNAQAGINIRMTNGATRSFDISDAALKSLKVHDGRSNLIFFTNGNQVTAICSRGEKSNMRVSARTGDTFTLQGDDGQSRLITLDAKTASRLHVKVGSHLQVTTESATSGKILALDLVKKHDFDKFNVAARSRTDVDAAKVDIDRAKVDIDVAKTKKAKKVDIDIVKADIDAIKVDIDTKKTKKLDIDVAKLDIDKHKLDIDVDKNKTDVDVDVDVAKSHLERAKIDIDIAKTKKAKKADIDVVKADIDAVKSDIDSAKTKKSKKLKSDLAKLDNDQDKLDTDVARNDGKNRVTATRPSQTKWPKTQLTTRRATTRPDCRTSVLIRPVIRAASANQAAVRASAAAAEWAADLLR